MANQLSSPTMSVSPQMGYPERNAVESRDLSATGDRPGLSQRSHQQQQRDRDRDGTHADLVDRDPGQQRRNERAGVRENRLGCEELSSAILGCVFEQERFHGDIGRRREVSGRDRDQHCRRGSCREPKSIFKHADREMGLAQGYHRFVDESEPGRRNRKTHQADGRQAPMTESSAKGWRRLQPDQ